MKAADRPRRAPRSSVDEVPTAAAQPVLILTGPPGVGKSTAAAILSARAERAVHLESDAFFRFISSGFVEPWKPGSRDQNQLVMRTAAGAAAAYAEAGYFTIVDGIVIPRWYLGTLREVFVAVGLRVGYAVLRAPLEACVERVNAREGGPLAEPGVIEQLWDEFAELGEFERHVIEVGDRKADEVGDEISRLLADERLAL
jgi:tRNA uridine 5-carbamoylmethylation protein Kti12